MGMKAAQLMEMCEKRWVALTERKRRSRHVGKSEIPASRPYMPKIFPTGSFHDTLTVSVLTGLLQG